MTEWNYVRDVVTLNDDLIDRIRNSSNRLPAPDATLIFAGRQITVQGDVNLAGYDLVILADRFDGSAGHLLLSGSSRAERPPRPDPTTVAFGDCEPAQSGLPGEQGGRGRGITLYCKEFLGLNVTSTGGAGGNGGQGQKGQDGGPGFGIEQPRGSDGCKGGAGGNGGGGGNGGNVRLRCLNPPGQGPRISELAGGSGGRPGNPGKGGFGGDGWENPHTGTTAAAGREGADGDPGSPGPAGAPGILDEAQVDAATYALLLAPYAAIWNPHRIRMGDYHHRRFAESERTLALAECDSVLAIEPANATAMLARSHILDGLTPVGLPRNIDVVADYKFFDGQYNTHRQPVAELFNAAKDMLLAAGNVSVQLENLDRAISSINGLLIALNSDLEAAQAAQTALRQSPTRRRQCTSRSDPATAR